MRIYISRKFNIKITLPWERERVQKFLIGCIILFTVAAVALGSVCAVMFFSVKRFTVEAGRVLSAVELTGDESAYFDDSFDLKNLNIPGVYYVEIYTGSGSYEARICVEDKKAPMISVKNINCAVNSKRPEPEDFIDTVFESGSFKGVYITPLPEIKAMGTYSAQVRYEDEWGNKTEVFDVSVTIVVDNEPPAISVPKVIEIELGYEMNFDEYVTLTDNCIGELSYTVDDSLANYAEVGSYEVSLTAVDAVGNRSSTVVTVRIVEPAVVTEEYGD